MANRKEENKDSEKGRGGIKQRKTDAGDEIRTRQLGRQPREVKMSIKI